MLVIFNFSVQKGQEQGHPNQPNSSGSYHGGYKKRKAARSTSSVRSLMEVPAFPTKPDLSLPVTPAGYLASNTESSAQTPRQAALHRNIHRLT